MRRYLQGNFAPIQTTRPLTPCKYTGTLPRELRGGQYVRNGGNPVTNDHLGRDAHWFDGDGMLSGVAFIESDSDDAVVPHFVNQFILTDVYLSLSSMTTPLRTPILPSIATLIDPLSTLYTITSSILRTVSLVVLSHLPGSLHPIKKISVANTGVLYHDGRALATCESGPPMRIALPTLDTIGWFNGHHAEGEGQGQGQGEENHEPMDTGMEAGTGADAVVIGGTGPLSFMREWTTAHPRSDPVTGELLLFHSTFIAPFVRYSVIPAEQDSRKTLPRPRLLNAAVPGISSPKMMHDFGVSPTHTIIMDLPLSLAPQNLARNLPIVSYDPSSPSRFGIFPRYSPQTVRWFHTDPCCIFHTANTWDSPDAVHLLACRLTSPSLIFSAGGIPVAPAKDDQCRLYYYQFPRDASSQSITHEWALLSLPFEFPSVPDAMSMSPARYIYGCSSASNFSAALGRAVKIDALVRVDVQQLIARGIDDPPAARVTGCVDTRSLDEIASSSDPNDPVRVFQLPAGWYAQEPRFVPRDGGSEEDGWLLTYVFDESQMDEHGNVGVDAVSELWIIDAPRMSAGMRAVVARVRLPQRVPYGLHGSWFSREEVDGQRPWNHSRSSELRETRKLGREVHEGLWGRARDVLISSCLA